jgi:hypothetical protein
LRYEDIVKSPEEKFREMAEFLGLGWTGRFSAVVNRTLFDTHRASAYLADLGVDNAERLERVLDSNLRRYGYAVAAPRAALDRRLSGLPDAGPAAATIQTTGSPAGTHGPI